MQISTCAVLVLVAGAAATATVDLENAQVRVIRPRYGPHDAMPAHEHPDRVIVPLTSGRLEQTLPDGGVTARDIVAGQASFSPPLHHAVRNLGEAPVELVEVEIKPLSKARAVALPDKVAQDPTHFSLVLENDKVRVLRFRLGPHERGLRHSDAPHVSVFTTPARIRLTRPDGSAQEAVVEKGAAAWTGVDEHVPENLGDEPLELISVEPKLEAEP